MGGNAVETKYRFLNKEPTSFKVGGVEQEQICHFRPGFSCPIQRGMAKLGDNYRLSTETFSEEQIRTAFNRLPVEIVHTDKIRTLDAELDPVEVGGMVVMCKPDVKNIKSNLPIGGSVTIVSPGNAVFIG